MADFCKQCAEELGFRNDFEYLQTKEDTREGLGTLVLCEGCGAIQVDHTGKCISEDCLKGHNPTPKELVVYKCSGNTVYWREIDVRMNEDIRPIAILETLDSSSKRPTITKVVWVSRKSSEEEFQNLFTW